MRVDSDALDSVTSLGLLEFLPVVELDWLQIQQ